MPLPSPRSVICSPSHIRNMVPPTRVTTVTNMNTAPGTTTSPGCACSATEMPMAWNSASTAVPYRVYWVIFLRPASPSFFSASRCGDTTVSSCMMIDAEM